MTNHKLSSKRLRVGVDGYKFDALFLVGTTDYHKTEEFQGAAWANQTSLGLRAAFVPLKWFALHPSTIEVGNSGQQIVNMKAVETESAFNHLRRGHSLHESFSGVLEKEKILPYEENRIFRLCDDATILVPGDILKKAAFILARHSKAIVNPYLLYEDPRNHVLKGAVEIIDGREFIHVIDS